MTFILNPIWIIKCSGSSGLISWYNILSIFSRQDLPSLRKWSIHQPKLKFHLAEVMCSVVENASLNSLMGILCSKIPCCWFRRGQSASIISYVDYLKNRRRKIEKLIIPFQSMAGEVHASALRHKAGSWSINPRLWRFSLTFKAWICLSMLGWLDPWIGQTFMESKFFISVLTSIQVNYLANEKQKSQLVLLKIKECHFRKIFTIYFPIFFYLFLKSYGE